MLAGFKGLPIQRTTTPYFRNIFISRAVEECIQRTERHVMEYRRLWWLTIVSEDEFASPGTTTAYNCSDRLRNRGSSAQAFMFIKDEFTGICGEGKGKIH